MIFYFKDYTKFEIVIQLYTYYKFLVLHFNCNDLFSE